MIRGEIWWADLGLPPGGEGSEKRPVLIIQDDAFNRSRIGTVIVASITSDGALAESPGNVFLEARDSGLFQDGVVDVSLLSSIDKGRLIRKVGVLPPALMTEVDFGLKLVCGIR